MNDSENKNPNQYLIKVGAFLILADIAAVLLKSFGLIYFVGVGVRIIILFWMPLAAKSVNRNPWVWTLLALVSPPITFIILGLIGYNQKHVNSSFFLEYNAKLKSKIEELTTKLNATEITKEEYDKQLADYRHELSDIYKTSYLSALSEEQLEAIHERLEKKGYVLDEKPNLFVEVKDRCPACNANVDETDIICPECGLNLKN